MRYFALLQVEIVEVYLGVKSVSRLAVEVGGDARCWRVFLVFWK